MKHSLTVKTTRCILPILIGIFVVSGTLISLPILKNIVSNAEISYELSDENAVVNCSPVAKMHFVLPLISLALDDTLLFKHQPEVNPTEYAVVRAKDIIRNFVCARAP